jgi:ketosteroid isomerase-like protein
MPDLLTVELLDAFADAFNRHDARAIVGMMTEDAVFEASAGPEIKGAFYRGRTDIERAFQDVFDTFPDARWRNPQHFVAGDRAVSEWIFSGTRRDGTRVEVQGCDVRHSERLDCGEELLPKAADLSRCSHSAARQGT